MAISQAIASWIILDYYEVPYVFIIIFIVVILTFIPLFAPWVLGACISLSYGLDGDITKALCLGLIYFYVTTKISGDIYMTQIKQVSQYLIGLSLAFGLYAFGITGFLYGPILICLLYCLLEIIRPGYN